MERGSSKHGARQDDALVAELAGELGPGGSNREEWAAAEPPADDDPPERSDLPTASDSASDAGMASGSAPDQDEAEMRRLRHDMEVANDWNPARDRS